MLVGNRTSAGFLKLTENTVTSCGSLSGSGPRTDASRCEGFSSNRSGQAENSTCAVPFGIRTMVATQFSVGARSLVSRPSSWPPGPDSSAESTASNRRLLHRHACNIRCDEILLPEMEYWPTKIAVVRVSQVPGFLEVTDAEMAGRANLREPELNFSGNRWNLKLTFWRKMELSETQFNAKFESYPNKRFPLFNFPRSIFLPEALR